MYYSSVFIYSSSFHIPGIIIPNSNSNIKMITIIINKPKT